MPWAVVFPQIDSIPRHPSQLYQFALEGLALFALLWLFSRKPRPTGAVSGLFLIGYGSFRFLAEFTREPDSFLGLLALNLSMGQWLSLPMIVAGIAMLRWAMAKRGKPMVSTQQPPGYRKVPLSRIKSWLGYGWLMFRQTQNASMAYAGIFAVIGAILLIGAVKLDIAPMAFPLAGGFMLVGPAFLAGFFHVATLRAQHRPVRFCRFLPRLSARPGGAVGAFPWCAPSCSWSG